jgi:tetratricopeptide (TPR) repeat protein
VFTHARPLIALSQREVFGGRVTPSASRLHFYMGAIEAGAGELERAHPLLEQAVKLEPTADAFRLLASIDRQRRDFKGALASLDRVIEITKGTGDAAAQAETHLLRFDVLREMGDERAEESLESALMLGLSALNLIWLFAYGEPEVAPIVTGYLGLLLLGGGFIAIGLFLSNLTRNQIVAGLLTYAVLLMLLLVAWVGEGAGPIDFLA